MRKKPDEFVCHCVLFSVCTAKGVRKDRGRVLRREKRRTGTSDRNKASKELEHRIAPPQDRRKHSSSAGCEGGKSSVISMPPDQVLIHVETMRFVFEILC